MVFGPRVQKRAVAAISLRSPMSTPVTGKTSTIRELTTTGSIGTRSHLTVPSRSGSAREKSAHSLDGGGEVSPAEFPFPWEELHRLPIRQLRLLCNKSFKLLDTDIPPVGVFAQYSALIEEINDREARELEQDVKTGGSGYKKSTVGFRDNFMVRRFELFVDGDLAGYLKYEMHGSQVILLDTVIRAEFSSPDSGIEGTLIRRMFLNAHQRRLAVRTRCRRVRAFLTEYPQYRSLVPATARRTGAGTA